MTEKEEKAREKIRSLRNYIDANDEQIMNLIAERLDLVRELAVVKKDAGFPILDSGREAQILNRVAVKRYAARLGPIMSYVLLQSRLEMYELLEQIVINDE